jgi:hypothetical protein
LMTAPNVLEFDWTSNAYRSHVGDVEHSFDTLAAARHALRLVGLRVGTKTNPRTWRIELMELAPPEGDIVSAAATRSPNPGEVTRENANTLSDFCVPLSIGFNNVFGRG